MKTMKYESALNSWSFHKIEAILHRVYTILHLMNISSVMYYRVSSLRDKKVAVVGWLLVFSSEVFLSFYSLLSLGFGWRHITRTAFPERLPEDEALPGMDVFILASDPGREPPWQVANTVISAMSLDYPTDKISVYVSDDGGSPLTLAAIKQGLHFAKWWVPYCRKYKIKTTCPKAYFGNHSHKHDCGVIFDVAADYLSARKEVEEKYIEFEKGVEIALEKALRDSKRLTPSRHDSPVIQVKWPRMGGLEGPILSGTCFYIKREALYGDIIRQRGYDLPQLKQYYGLSNEFIKSIQQSNSHRIKLGELTSAQLSEAKFLASSTFEQNTRWGDTVGFMYASVVEDYMTGFSMQCRGWKSVFYNPERPAFLGTATINLNDAFIQTTRWHTGFVDVAFSRFFPLFYGPFVNNLSLLQSMCYAYFAIQPLCCFPFWCLAIVPQLCLLLGIPLYPQATSPWFMVFSFALLSRLSKNLADVLITGSSTRTWWNEERFWMMRGVTSSLYGSIDSTLKKVGLKESSFTTTNKVDDNERIELYNKGMFDFRASTKFIIPLVGLVIFNLASFFGGVLRAFILDQWNELLGQISLSFFVILLGYPIIEGMVVRSDDARISTSVSLKSALFAIGLFITGSVLLHV